MNQPKQIGIFTGFYFPHFGGVEKYVSGLAEQLNIKGYIITIITSNTENVAENEFKGNLEVIRLPVFDFFKERYPFLNCLSLKFWRQIKYLEKKNFDFFIINTRFYLTTLVGLMIASNQKKRCIIIEHGSGHLITKNPIINFFASQYEHFLSWRIKKYHPIFYGVSIACNRWLRHFNINAAGVIYNGVDINFHFDGNPLFRRHFNMPSDQIIFSSASRLIPEKGVLELVNAFDKFSTSHENAHLFLAGDGPFLEFFKIRFRSHRQIHILGKLQYEEVMNLFWESDVVIVPSRYPEGLPTVILEAGLANCAVITTDVGGSSEVINTRESGLLIKKNDECELLLAMDELYNDEQLRKSMALNLRNKVIKHFDWSLITKDLLSESFFIENDVT